MQTKKIILLIIISCLFSFNILESNKRSLLEKVYTQIDRPLYFPGETIWFKSYITTAENKVSTISEILYAELISPKGTVVKDIKLSIHQGYAYGDFQISENWVGGLYKLRTYTNWMKNFGKGSFFEKEIIVQKVVSPNLLMKLEFDKKAYGAGSKVISHFEVKNLKNIPKSNQEIKFEVSVKGEQFLSETISTNSNGKQDIVFTLPNDLKTTDVILNVLVPYKSSRESISRSVPITLNSIDLQFFPESGNAILDIENKIAFKALNEFGKPADVSGEIVDEKGQLITNFQSYHDGMGSFIFTPNKSNYYAKITAPFQSDSLISLPKIQSLGTRFRIREETEAYVIDMYSSNNKSLHLTVSNSYRNLLSKEIKIANNTEVFKLHKDKLPIGIIKISLKDTNEDIVAERLLFANKSKESTIDISLDKRQYKTREKVTVHIRTTNKYNEPIPSNLSISIADNKLVSFADDKQDNIYSYLLLSSELKGKIYKPSFYFDTTENKASKALEYVMLTHGWRTYIKKNLALKNATFQPDLKATQYGKIVDKNYKAVQAHLLLFDQYSDKVLRFDTNEKGEFSFKVDRNSSLVLLAYTDDHKKLHIIKEKFVKSSFQNDKFMSEGISKSPEFKQLDINKPLSETVKEKVLTSNKLGVELSGDNSLDEVVVIGYGTQTKRSLSSAVVTVVENDEISTSTLDNIGQLLQGKVAGVMVTNNSGLSGSSSTIAIRGTSTLSGNSQPLVIIDGVPIDQGGTVGGALYNIEASNVQSVNVLKGAAASSIYGSHGLNGVIIVTTKNQKFNRLYGSKSLNNKKFRNYEVATFYNYSPLKTYSNKQFYIPVYNNNEQPENRNDFRQTIYWNPVIQTDKKGEASFEYYNSDAITSFIITAEGIGYNGLIGRNETTYATKKLLNIDFKTPSYMALNDTIQLPIIVTNETDEHITTRLELDLPEELKLLSSFEKKMLSIEPNSNQTQIITLVPIRKSKNATIKVSAISDNYNDKIDKNITIISPYFPTEASISGYKNDSYRFDINNIVDGSLQAGFTIYTDIVGNVMDGIESLIRQPYGCFEQVSSATYPNILILKYLKETGKSNPEIEKKAMAFIKSGYKKLAAYETAQNGFEWFGHTPPHETLSAYGILEFTEMKEVYNAVDQKMINRTVKWLLSRRDGKGGFKKSTKGYDSFTGSPKDVANAYIIYALSESGVDVNIEREYSFTYQEALKSNDTYRMALLALASMNLNKTENARILFTKIKTNIKKYGFQKLPVDNTITRSYGDAKEIETAAFTILSLLAQGDNEYIVSQGIEFLISKRKSGRFGSTQSTSMALKALIEYTKTQKQKMITQDNVFEIQINSKKIKTRLKLNNEGKIVIENIERHIKEGTQHVKVSFSDPEITFPYMLNVTWDSTIPNSSSECKLALKTEILNPVQSVGQNMRMNIVVKNKTNNHLPMATAIIGIPSGTAAQPWQLKEILEQHKADYFEIFDNYLVFYWKEFDKFEVKKIQLDLKAEILGTYQAPASTVYLYYADDHKHWTKGSKVSIE